MDVRPARAPRASRQLAGALAHDFANLLQVIVNHTELVAGSLDPTGPEQEDVRCILEAAKRAGILARRLIDDSRANRWRDEAIVDAGVVTADTVRMLGRSLGSDVHIELHSPEGPVPVRIDPVELDQVVVNLLVNARDSMTSGGTITVALRSLSDRQVEISVTDQGIGMTPEVLERAFAPFFTTKGEAGKGLGLATSREIVVRHGGSMEASSRPGLGSRFLVRLPLVTVVD